jgi:hypothetical protein
MSLSFSLVTFSFSFFLFSVSSQCAGSEVKPLTEDRGCDSVLLGQSYRTPHGAVKSNGDEASISDYSGSKNMCC